MTCLPENQTLLQEFIFQGFILSRKHQIFMFLAIFTVYIFTLLGNILIVSLVCITPHLQNPMYTFLSNFSFTEICYTSVIIPQLLTHIFAERKNISYAGCLLQLYLCSSFGCTECMLLSSMAYDRYLAICHPLHYSFYMRRSVYATLNSLSWAGGMLGSLLPLFMIFKLVFCKANTINHFFCDSIELFTLSCTDISISKFSVFFFASVVVHGSSHLIILSYAVILCTILRMPSTSGKLKRFSTCASHLLVVSLFYGTLIFTYVASPERSSKEINKGLSLLYTVVTPLLNPIIYSLRNNDIHLALSSTIKKLKGTSLY